MFSKIRQDATNLSSSQPSRLPHDELCLTTVLQSINCKLAAAHIEQDYKSSHCHFVFVLFLKNRKSSLCEISGVKNELVINVKKKD